MARNSSYSTVWQKKWFLFTFLFHLHFSCSEGCISQWNELLENFQFKSSIMPCKNMSFGMELAICIGQCVLPILHQINLHCGLSNVICSFIHQPQNFIKKCAMWLLLFCQSYCVSQFCKLQPNRYPALKIVEIMLRLIPDHLDHLLCTSWISRFLSSGVNVLFIWRKKNCCQNER